MDGETNLLQCPRCGTLNPRGYKFCGQCGAPLAERQPGRTGKSPQLATILLTLGCLAVVGSLFLPWTYALFTVICGFGGRPPGQCAAGGRDPVRQIHLPQG